MRCYLSFNHMSSVLEAGFQAANAYYIPQQCVLKQDSILLSYVLSLMRPLELLKDFWTTRCLWVKNCRITFFAYRGIQLLMCDVKAMYQQILPSDHLLTELFISQVYNGNLHPGYKTLSIYCFRKIRS